MPNHSKRRKTMRVGSVKKGSGWRKTFGSMSKGRLEGYKKSK